MRTFTTSRSEVRAPAQRTWDEECVRLIRDGDVAAFREMFDAFAPSLIRFARQYLGTTELAEETVHDVFLSVWALGPEWEPRGAVRPYLFSAVRNACIDHLRQRQRKPEERSFSESDIFATTEGSYAALRQKELQAAAQRAIEEMPERRRLVFLLSRQQDLTYAEIAAVMGISVNTVEVQIVRALKFLRERLSPMLTSIL